MTSIELSAALYRIPLRWVFGAVVLGFLTLYFGFALGALLLRARILPGLGWGCELDHRPLRPRQILEEIGLSLSSICVFGVYGVVTVYALRLGIVRVVTEFRWSTIVLDCTLVFIWNELHFYACHRFLHGRWWMRHVHLTHHRSRVPTPFSIYAFHWMEAVLLGSVMLTAMLVHDFHLVAILLLPVLSIAGNVLGHINYELFPHVPQHHVLAMSRRHGLHHAHATQNYGFLLSVADRMFGTEHAVQAASNASRQGEERSTASGDGQWCVPRFVGARSKYLVGGLILVVAVVCYGLSNRYPVFAPILVSPSLFDRWVPLVPWTAWIYATYPVLFTSVFVLEKDALRLNQFLFAVVLLNVLSQVFFVFLPTTLDRAPFIIHPTVLEGGTSLLARIQHIDEPSNCLPSLHVSAAWLAALFARSGKRAGSGWVVLWAVAVALSTLTTKQHLLVDGVSGAVLAGYVYWFSCTQVRFKAVPARPRAPTSSAW